MTESPAQLEYAPPPPLHRRRTFRRLLVSATVLAAALGSWIIVPRVWQTTQLLLRQREVMRFVLPPTTVVAEPDRERAAALWQIGSPYVMRPPGGVFHVPQIARGQFKGDALFLHGLRRPDGTPRIVHVSVGVRDRHTGTLRTWVAKPATFMNPRIGGFTADHDLPPGPSPRHPRMFAGQPDPNDPSHFTIKYEYPDRSGTIHGRLKDDDTIVFEWTVDEQPTTQPSAVRG